MKCVLANFFPSLLVKRCNVLLLGWVIWKYWYCLCKCFSFGNWLASAPSPPNGREGHNSATDLNPNTITSIQLQCIQAASPHLAEKTTSKPQPNIFLKIFSFRIFCFFSYYIQHCFICRPSDSTVPTDAGIEPRTVATGALAVRRSSH